MDGSLWGDIIGIGYLCLFMAAGIWMSWCLFAKESMGMRILVGSVMGSVLMQWLPALCAILLGFTIAAHGTALILLCFILLAVTWNIVPEKPKQQQKYSGKKKGRSAGKQHTKKQQNQSAKKKVALSREDKCFLILATLLFVFFCYLLKTHTIPMSETGGYDTGQATYGDMNMHFSFITSLARQGKFPPEYSILPGNRICYPFLCDSISASVYIWGSSLRLAYNLPMLIAFWQVMGGVYLLVSVLFRKWSAILTWILFFFDGGLGVLYFVNVFGENGTKNFTRIFTEFYQTPTNLVDDNVRWTNIVADMLLPQRATLFGWAVLFPTILILAVALQQKKRSYMIVAGILTGAMPMIHTHSFVAMAFICAIWLLGSLLQEIYPKWMEQKPILERGLFLFGFLLFNLLSFAHISKTTQLSDGLLLGIAISGGVVITLGCIWAVWKGWTCSSGSKQIVIRWGIFLALVLVLALPQLFTWTFQQAQGEQFLRGSFNWCNENEQFLSFYLKNLGLMFVFTIIAVFCMSRKTLWKIGPAFFIWFITELVLFQPNPYDNNKLLLVAYVFFAMLVSEWMLGLWEKMQKQKLLRGILMSLSLFLMTISAILTMGREAVSHYELYPADEVEMCHYIEENLEADAVILTDTRHNNGISSLTGRNIVCGSSSILYYHGLPYQQAEADVGQMYANPANQDLLAAYGVDYILVGPSERYNYSIADENAFSSNYVLIHEEGEYHLYQCQ